jgi:hypothetical protein
MIMHRLAICVVLASSLLIAPRPAAAAVTDFYDTIDAVEVANGDSNPSTTLRVTGIRTGQTESTVTVYNFGSSSSPSNIDMAMHCQRLAVLVMSKPGKFQYAIGPGPNLIAHGCKLIARTP